MRSKEEYRDRVQKNNDSDMSREQELLYLEQYKLEVLIDIRDQLVKGTVSIQKVP
jgi:hypothetical protein